MGWPSWLWIPVALVTLACGGGDDDDDTMGTGGGSGTNGTAGAAAGRGGMAGSAGMTAGAGSGGGGASAGAAGASGSSMGGTSGGTGGGGVPVPTGTIGEGPVSCSDAAGDCAGTACCRAISGYSCVASFAECSCSTKGNCTVVGCDSNADCGGGKCCALRNTRASPGYVATSCKSACDPEKELQVCTGAAECAAGEMCEPSSAEFSICF